MLDCGVNPIVCCYSRVRDIEDYFWGELYTQESPPPLLIGLKKMSFVCATFVLDYSVNPVVCTAPLHEILRINLGWPVDMEAPHHVN